MIDYVEVANRAGYISATYWFVVLTLIMAASIVVILLISLIYGLIMQYKDGECSGGIIIAYSAIAIALCSFVAVKVIPINTYVSSQYSNLLSIAEVSGYNDLKNIIKNVDYLKYRYELMWNSKNLLINGEKCSKDYYVNAVLNKFYGTVSENYEYSFDSEYDALVGNLKK